MTCGMFGNLHYWYMGTWELGLSGSLGHAGVYALSLRVIGVGTYVIGPVILMHVEC